MVTRLLSESSSVVLATLTVPFGLVTQPDSTKGYSQAQLAVAFKTEGVIDDFKIKQH